MPQTDAPPKPPSQSKNGTTVALSRKAHRGLKRHAASTGMKLYHLVDMIVCNWLKDNERTLGSH